MTAETVAPVGLNGDVVENVTASVQALSDRLLGLVTECTDPEGRDLAELLWSVREARVFLLSIERTLEEETAKSMLADNAESGTLRVERSRRPDRKSWEHAAWQAEVRRKVIQAEGLKGAHVISADGEELDVSLEAVVRRVQEVHGSAAPKVTGLRGLGIDADDYCERSPGPWAVKVTRMADEGASQ
ncbi:hypothetical protein SAMN05428985_11082 [Nocardioides sp. YR527]|uniref:hypothetical protein n=1 Tax=Nocardioides sp. YR527 TaxID=1881028 RepID=UPI000890A347|nr:hypothetical protein [Nocardioides sp. YR527]SDL15322.1 hypothetical protein SAMN05428985_11082 [Nocardioides sp. YR527]